MPTPGFSVRIDPKHHERLRTAANRLKEGDPAFEARFDALLVSNVVTLDAAVAVAIQAIEQARDAALDMIRRSMPELDRDRTLGGVLGDGVGIGNAAPVGHTRRAGKKSTLETDRAIMEMHREGKSMPKIKSLMGFSHGKIHRTITAMKLAGGNVDQALVMLHRTPRQLTPEVADEIQAKGAEGRSRNEVGLLVGVSAATIRKVLAGG
jgi:hypothetical protein